MLLPLAGRTQWAVWVEEFENGCTTGCYAAAYAGVNGAWSVTNLGAQGACANRWFVSCRENGNAVGTCGTDCTSNNETLHVGNELVGVCASPNGCAFCPTGDCGAAYDAGCPAALCAFCSLLCGTCSSTLTDQRAQSPVIDLTGYSTLTLGFKYMENGQGTQDNASVWWFDGTTWALLSDMPKTPVGGCGGQGQWTTFSVALPASANNNANVRIGFRWVNDNDGSGSDPSFAVDDVELSIPYTPDCSGLLVNELSNGSTGAQEFIELLACGAPCTTIDIRNWKVDDNNGAGLNAFGTTLPGSGSAAGHLRFSNAAQWATLPVGALIVIYNNTDVNPLVPPDDPNDTAPNDSVYVLPANHALLQGCGTAPNPVSNSSYAGCAFGGGNWNYVSLRNVGDAGQTRFPDGRYFHGISYGSTANGMNNGGLDNLRISAIDHTGRVLFFNSGSPRTAANFTSATVAGNETPGAPNNAANALYIEQLQCLTMPIELLSFTGEAMPDRVRLRWTTATETDNDHFSLERSADGIAYDPIGTVRGAGDSQAPVDYVFDDGNPLRPMGLYRLRQTDLDGATTNGPVIVVAFSGSPAPWVTPDGTNGWWLHDAPTGASWRLWDPLGRLVAQGQVSAGGTTQIPEPGRSAACYSLSIVAAEATRTLKLPSVAAFRNPQPMEP